MFKSYWCLLIKTPKRIHEVGQSIAPFSFYGSMKWLNNNLVPFSHLDYLNMLMRSISQVAFINNPVSGLIIATAMLVEDPWLFFIGVWGCFFTILFAKRFDFDSQSIRNGTVGFSGFLVGSASHLVLSRIDHSIWFSYLVITTILSFISVLIMVFMTKTYVKRTRLPLLTIPYNISLIILVFFIFMISKSPFENHEVNESFSTSLEWSNITEIILTNFSQIYFFSSPYTGLMIFFSMLVGSIFTAFFAFNGILILVFYINIFSISEYHIISGLIGYNVVLTSIFIGCIYFKPNLNSFFVSVFACFFTTFFAINLYEIFFVHKIPSFTIPFCFCTIITIKVLELFDIKKLLKK